MRLLHNLALIHLVLALSVVVPSWALRGFYTPPSSGSSSDGESPPRVRLSTPSSRRLSIGDLRLTDTLTPRPRRPASVPSETSRSERISQARERITPLTSPHTATPHLARTPDHVSPVRRPPPTRTLSGGSIGSTPSHVSTPDHLRSPSPPRSPKSKELEEVANKLKALAISKGKAKDFGAGSSSGSGSGKPKSSHSGASFHGHT